MTLLHIDEVFLNVAGEGNLRSEKILLVEENPDERALASRLLKIEIPTSELVEVKDWEVLEEVLASDSFDLVLTGNKFSWGNGLTVLSLVRRHLPACPVVMLTGQGSEEIACEALKRGFADYLPAKASGYLALGKRVKKILAGAVQPTPSGLVGQYLRLLDLLEEPVFLTTRDGYLLQVNPAFSRLVKDASPETLRGRRLSDFIQDSALSQFLRQLDPDGEPKTVEVPLKGGDRVRITASIVEQGAHLPTLLVGRLDTVRPSSDLPPLAFEQPDVLSAPQPAGPETEEVDLEKVIDDVLQDLASVVKEIGVTVLRGKMPIVEANRRDMLELFRNLLTNVVVRSQAPREIDITAHRMPVEWLFILKDSGSRIPEADLASSPLAVSLRIVARQGGRLWLAPESDTGSNIYFTLPTQDQGGQQGQVDGARAENEQ